MATLQEKLTIMLRGRAVTDAPRLRFQTYLERWPACHTRSKYSLLTYLHIVQFQYVIRYCFLQFIQVTWTPFDHCDI